MKSRLLSYILIVLAMITTAGCSETPEESRQRHEERMLKMQLEYQYKQMNCNLGTQSIQTTGQPLVTPLADPSYVTPQPSPTQVTNVYEDDGYSGTSMLAAGAVGAAAGYMAGKSMTGKTESPSKITPQHKPYIKVSGKPSKRVKKRGR